MTAPSPVPSPTPSHQQAPAANNQSVLIPLGFILLWSTGFIGAKLGAPYTQPMSFLAWRFLIVIVLMLGIALALRSPWPTGWRTRLHIGISGLLVHATYLGGVFTAIYHGLPSGITALVVGLQPLLTALVAVLFGHEKLRPVQWLGLVLGLAGVAFVVAEKIATLPGPQWLGMLLPAIVALFGITFGALYQKRFCPSFDLRTGSVLQYAPCLVVMGLLAYWLEPMPVQWTGEFIFALGWLVLVLSIAAVMLLNLLIRTGSAVNVASLFYLTPAITALVAWLLFDEKLTSLALLGMAITATGVWLVRKEGK